MAASIASAAAGAAHAAAGGGDLPEWDLRTAELAVMYERLELPGPEGAIPAAPAFMLEGSLRLVLPGRVLPWLPQRLARLADPATGLAARDGVCVPVVCVRLAPFAHITLQVASGEAEWDVSGRWPAAAAVAAIAAEVPERVEDSDLPDWSDFSLMPPPGAGALDPVLFDTLVAGGLTGGPWGALVALPWPPAEPGGEASAAEDRRGEPKGELEGSREARAPLQPLRAGGKLRPLHPA